MNELDKVVKPTLHFERRACFARINDVTIMVTDIQKWSNELLLEYLNDMKKVGKGMSAPGSVAVFLGDSFDTGQRKLSSEWLAENGLEPAKRITMISDSLLIRGSLTAYSWLTKTEAKAFAMKDHKAMCEWIAQGRIAEAEDIHAALVTSFQLLGKKLP